MCLYRKTENGIRLSVIKINISTNFMLLRSKLTSEISQKIESLDKKITQNWFKMWFFFISKLLHLKKNEKRYLFSFIKIEISANFMHSRLKLTPEICQKVASLDFRTVLICKCPFPLHCFQKFFSSSRQTTVKFIWKLEVSLIKILQLYY